MEEQQARISAAAVAPRPIRVAIAEAQGLLCAEEVVTERPLPGFDQAAIDGYAVRSVDVLGVGDHNGAEVFGDESAFEGRDVVTLPVMGTIDAGARTPAGCSHARPPASRPAPRCRRWPMQCCRCAGPTAA